MSSAPVSPPLVLSALQCCTTSAQSQQVVKRMQPCVQHAWRPSNNCAKCRLGRITSPKVRIWCVQSNHIALSTSHCLLSSLSPTLTSDTYASQCRWVTVHWLSQLPLHSRHQSRYLMVKWHNGAAHRRMIHDNYSLVEFVVHGISVFPLPYHGITWLKHREHSNWFQTLNFKFSEHVF